MNTNELCSLLSSACAGGMSALRVIVKLAPVEGDGGKVAPPTHEGGQYAWEKRFVDGRPDVETVLLDSVQSMANRFEELLLGAVRGGAVKMPLLEMNIGDHGTLTSLTVPHRAHDAIFRDSRYKGVRFRESEIGKLMVAARVSSATGMFQICPTAILFGTWDSQSGAGVNSAKFARCMVSEIVAFDAVRGVKSSSRIDPLGIKAMPGTIFESKDEQWTLDASKAVQSKGKPQLYKSKGTPAEINHGNIPPTLTNRENGPGGVTFREARQTTVLSFTQLRKLRFPLASGSDHDIDVAGRAVIAALGVLAIALQLEDGYQLRSRCQLIPMEAPQFEWIGAVATDTRKETIAVETAIAALQNLYAAAKAKGLNWHEEPVVLQPEDKLVELVKMSDQSTDVEE